jgi:hypothetical protein
MEYSAGKPDYYLERTQICVVYPTKGSTLRNGEPKISGEQVVRKVFEVPHQRFAAKRPPGTSIKLLRLPVMHNALYMGFKALYDPRVTIIDWSAEHDPSPIWTTLTKAKICLSTFVEFALVIGGFCGMLFIPWCMSNLWSMPVGILFSLPYILLSFEASDLNANLWCGRMKDPGHICEYGEEFKDYIEAHETNQTPAVKEGTDADEGADADENVDTHLVNDGTAFTDLANNNGNASLACLAIGGTAVVI